MLIKEINLSGMYNKIKFILNLREGLNKRKTTIISPL